MRVHRETFRIEHYDARDGEYLALQRRVAEAAALLAPGFVCGSDLVCETRADVPYESTTVTRRFGTQECGVEVLHRVEEYEAGSRGFVRGDIVRVSAFGLPEGVALVATCTREPNRPANERVLEVSLSGDAERVAAARARFLA